jgi:dihydrofolate reductase
LKYSARRFVRRASSFGDDARAQARPPIHEDLDRRGNDLRNENFRIAQQMIGELRIEGFAIVSADGMLADSDRRIPSGLVIAEDQEFFQDSLDRAAFIVHGRHSGEGGPRAAARRRLVVTRQIPDVAPDPSNPNALLWNPQGASLEEAFSRLGAAPGICAVIGGPDVYALFLDFGYDAFHLSQAPHVRIPGGRPLFPGIGPTRRPQDILAAHGLIPGPPRLLDSAGEVTLVTWTRTAL